MSSGESEVYLLRHGETEWNAAGRFQRRLDSPLTARGRADVVHVSRTLANTLTNHDVLELHVSPLGRTIATAEILQSEISIGKVIVEPRLAEISLGSWDGLTHIDIDARWPGRVDGADRYDFYFRSPDGEPFEAALERAREWLCGLTGSVIAVSHGLFGRLVRGAYLGLSQREMLVLPVSHTDVWRLHRGVVDQVGV